MTDELLGRALPAIPSARPSLIQPAGAGARSEGRSLRAFVYGRRLTDLAAIGLAVAVVPVIGTFFPTAVGEPDRPKAAVAVMLALIWFVLLRIGPLPEKRRVIAEHHEYRRVVARSVTLFGALAGFSVAVVHVPGIRWDLLIVFPVGTLLLLSGRAIWRARLATHRAAGRTLSRAVLVGSSRDIQAVSRALPQGPRAFSTVGVVLTDSGEVEGLPDETLVFTGIDAVVDAIEIAGADTVILAGAPNDGGETVRELAWKLEATEAHLVLAASVDGIGASRLTFQPIDGLSVVHVTTPAFTGGRHRLKRMIDIALSLGAVIALAPVFAVLAVLVRADSRGPALFRQTRIGRDGRPFIMYKFRSMQMGAERDLARLAALNEGSGLLFKLRADPRVTRIGFVLRRYSLDELPQLFNVLRGDMSLVGPRPPLASEVAGYEGHTHRRLFLKPGLTGLWQISGRSNLSWEQSIRLDLFYVANWSPLGDLAIMARTVRVILRPDGAY